jgi:hypothetical protein
MFARFAVIIAGWVLSECWRGRFRQCWNSHQSVEVWPRPQHEVIVIWHELAVIRLAGTPP